jgi:NTE family protein
VVLGGGGSTGNAWLIGVAAGLFDNGVDITTAALTIGTSAGATAAAQMAAASPSDLFAAIVDPANQPPAALRATSTHLDATGAVIASSSDAIDMRRRMGAWARGTEVALDPAKQERWRATVAARLPNAIWPQRRILITAVDAQTGEPVVFDRTSGVNLADAVAASCAGGFAFRIGDRQFIDGGYRTNADNADLAAGHERVLVLSPFGGKSRLPAAWGMHLAHQIDDLRAGGAQVEAIFPAREYEHMFGSNAMNVSLRPDAARAGYQQGRARASALRTLWG